MPDNLHILSPRGFSAAGVSCGIKRKAGALDLGLLVADQPAAAAAVFTTNKVVAAPVILGREAIAAGRLRGVVVNSGNANACTGEQGLTDAREMARLASAATGHAGRAGDANGDFLVSSTGVIGHLLPMDKLRAGIADAASKLDRGADAAAAFARAIMTTDLVPKVAGLRVDIGGVTVTVAGCCKGSGMIAPNMATMLAYLTTDARIGSAALGSALRSAADVSFNAITVDGHTSTNDTLLALASGACDATEEIAEGSSAYAQFSAALTAVCQNLARQIIADGEGATRVVEVIVEGAASESDARLAAMAVANSPLVKTAVHGGDPNWGRVVSAVGYSGAKCDMDKLQHWVGEELVFDAGTPTKFNLAQVQQHMQGKHIILRVALAQGRACFTAWTCDLSREYITINADYHT